MTAATIALDTLPPDLIAEVERFETEKAAYVAQQNNLVALDQEVAKIRWKVTTTKHTADSAETAYRKLASEPGVSQTEISAEIVRVEELRREAQALAVTADARAGIRGPCIVRLAEMRLRIAREPLLINAAYHAHRLGQLLARADMREYLLELFGLCRAATVGNLTAEPSRAKKFGEMDGMVGRNEEAVWAAFTGQLENLFDGAEKNATGPVLAELPEPVTGEVVVRSPVEMMKLKREYA